MLDTNVLVSGLLNSQGNPSQVVSLALRGALKLYYDSRILDEYIEVLHRSRFKFDPKRIKDILARIELDGTRCEMPVHEELDLPDKDD